MLASDFQRKVRKCNTDLHIYCGNDDSKPAGLYFVKQGQYQEICGVDKNWLPEWPITNEKGRILKGGWRRAVKVLIERKLVDAHKAERVFGTQLIGNRKPSVTTTWSDPVEKEIQANYVKNFSKTGKPTLKRDEVMDLAKEITKQHEAELTSD
jgi:hypothetical protein